MKIVTFPLKYGETPKRVVDFLRERDTFRTKIMEINDGFVERKSQEQRQTLEIVEDFASEAKFLHFLDLSSVFFIFRLLDFIHFSSFSLGSSTLLLFF